MRTGKTGLFPALTLMSLAFCAIGGCRGGDRFTVSGTVEARDAELASRIGGRVVSVHAQEGQRVERGQLLVKFDAAPLKARLAEARAAFEETKARLAELVKGTRRREIAKAGARLMAARASADNSYSRYQRAERLHAAEVISEQELDQLRASHEVAQAQFQEAKEHLALLREGPRQEEIEAARAAARRAEASVRRAQVDLRETRLLAPWTGVVDVFDVEPGDFVGPGVPVARIADPGRLWVTVYVPVNLLGFVSTGAEVSVRVDSFPQRCYRGRVVTVATEAEFTPRNIQAPEDRVLEVFAVKVELLETESLRGGMAADVTISRTSGLADVRDD